MQARAEELLAVVGLEPATYAKRYPAQLSGGERQRVGVARALAADPPIMLMDEPFGAVDPIVRERLQNEFLRLQEQLAKTILFVTHDIDEAIKMGDLVAVFQAGGRRRPVRSAGRDPREPGVRLRRAVRGDRPRPQAPEPVPRRGAAAVAGRHGAGGRRRGHRAAGRGGAAVRARPGHRARRPARGLGPPGPPDDGTITGDQVESTSPLLDRRTTLKDALSMLLDADVQAGLVVDRTGALRGMVTVGDITALMREGDARPLNATERAAADAADEADDAAATPACRRCRA